MTEMVGVKPATPLVQAAQSLETSRLLSPPAIETSMVLPARQPFVTPVLQSVRRHLKKSNAQLLQLLLQPLPPPSPRSPPAAVSTEGLLPDAPIDSQTKSAEELGIDVKNLIDSYYAMSLPFDAFELDPKTKFPKASLRSVVANFVAKTLLSFKEMGMYADVPQYDRNGILDLIKKASDLPKDTA